MDYLIKYWYQFALLISILFGGIGYLLKLYFAWNIKRKEILFSKIKVTKIDELKEFYKSYIELEFELKNLQSASAVNDIEYEKELRSKLPMLWKSFYFNLTYIRLFLYDDELELFESLYKELNNIHLKLDFYKIEREYGNINKELRSELISIRDDIFPRRLPGLLRKIEYNVKEDFGLRKRISNTF